MYIQCIHEMSTAFSCPSGRGNFDGQELLATPLRLPRRNYEALVVYIYIYILATLNTCIGEVFPCLTAESAVASHRFNRKWWCAAFQRLLRDMKKLWINASSGDLGALKFRSLPSRTSVPHLNVHQLQQWTSWVRMLLLYRIWIPLFYHHVPTRYIYMAYIGQHRGMFRKQVVGYSCKGTHIIPLMFSR